MELSMAEGEVVKVLKEHDLDKNPDWWLVENFDGQTGYVPANYLIPIT